MSPAVKMLIGLAATLAMGWLAHGPLGQGEALVSGLEKQARTAVAASELEGIDVRLSRDPLSRVATLSGPANDFQREGMGSEPGLTDLVAGVDGIGAVAWADKLAQGRSMPLLAETLLLLALAYLIGLAFAWFLWGRKRREGFA
jgi:hypothetical protein